MHPGENHLRLFNPLYFQSYYSIKKRKRMNTITTITDLIKFLKVGTSNGKTNQEVLVKKITQDATYEESTQSFRDFGSQHKEVNIPQTIYLNKDNNVWINFVISWSFLMLCVISVNQSLRVIFKI